MMIVFGWVALGFLLGGFAMWQANLKVDTLTAKRRWTKFGVYVAIVYTVMLCAWAGTPYFFALAAMIATLGGVEIARVCRSQWRLALFAYGIYLPIVSGFLLFAAQTAPETVLFVYVTVAAFDGFSQATGQLFGKHRLAPHISPNKTIEGMIGGMVIALVIAALLRTLPEYSITQAVLLGTGICAAGLGGDLLASRCKRAAGAKDFGRLLPGHGGILDRFDSVLAAGCAFWLLRIIFIA